ncbi:Serine hydroxymethyltransferase-like domain [Trypanosoma melophagium]|uniref:Serine hydroxymethyltransferase-like domain n=1 Tax=Trypanosoma melophagium TaxID=715481 RepID=UPI00351A04C8|nr:Serine hydroxymethyltransferase-like domain [Trypanosoma melophagium]
MSLSLNEHDPELYDIIEKEKARQFRSLELIASENLTSRAVMECLGSCLTNKYAEGECGNRYYGGTEYVDMVENAAKTRALQAFSLDASEWGVNVQPYSGSPANFAVYTALLQPHGRIMGLDLPSGGHLTHGFYTAKKKISATSVYFESFPYKVDADGIIDYTHLEEISEVFRPAMIIIGASAYSRDYDYPRLRALCDNLGCLLFMDMAHTAGLIAGGVLKSPFPYADVVSTTTHKSLRGPRSGMIFFRKKDRNGNATDFESRVNQAVFPGLQGGPHMHQIAGIATQMKEVCDPAWKLYAQQVVRNAQSLAAELIARGHRLVSEVTENHIVLWNVRHLGLTGNKVEKLLDLISISANKNAIPGDKSALTPGGVRLGTCALTTRGMVESDMLRVAEFLHRAATLCLELQNQAGPKLKDFVEAMHVSEALRELRAEVEKVASSLYIPGIDCNTLRYKDGIPVNA